MADRDVTVDIIGRDKTGKATEAAARGFDKVSDRAKSANREIDKTAGALSKVKSAVSKVSGMVTGAVSSIGSKIAPVLLVALAAGLPAISAAITSALLLGAGGGFLAIAALALKENKRLKGQFEKTGKTIQRAMARAAKPLVGPFVKALRTIGRLFNRDLEPQFRSIFKALKPIVPILTQGFGGFLKNVVGGLKDSMPGVTAAFRGLAAALPIVGKTIGDFFRSLSKNPKVIENTTRLIMQLVTGPLKLLGPMFSALNVIFGAQANLMRLLHMTGQTLFGAFVQWFDGGTGAISRMKEAWGPLATALQNVWNKLKAFAAEQDSKKLAKRFSDLVTAIKQTWGPLKTFLGVVWSEAWNFVKRKWNEVVVPWWNGTAKPWLKRQVSAFVGEVFRDAANRAKAEIGKLPGKVIGALASLPGKLMSIGRQIVRGLVQGIASGAGAVGATVSRLVAAARAAIPAALRGALGFSSGGGAWRPAVVVAGFSGGGSGSGFSGGSGGSRSGGPTPVSLTSHLYLDGQPFRAHTERTVVESERRQAWRAKTGKR